MIFTKAEIEKVIMEIWETDRARYDPLQITPVEEHNTRLLDQTRHLHGLLEETSQQIEALQDGLEPIEKQTNLLLNRTKYLQTLLKEAAQQTQGLQKSIMLRNEISDTQN